MAVEFNRLLDMYVDLYKLNGVEAAYIDLRVIRNTVPDGIHVYEVRDTSDDGGDYFGNVEDDVLVNHAGTFFTKKPLIMLHPDWLSHGVYIDLSDDSEPWESIDSDRMTLRDFLAKEAS